MLAVSCESRPSAPHGTYRKEWKGKTDGKHDTNAGFTAAYKSLSQTTPKYKEINEYVFSDHP